MTIFGHIKKFILIFLKYASLVFFSLVAIIPLVSCVITAFKPDAEYNSTNVMTPPSSWLYFENFASAFKKAGMGRAFINSTIILIAV